MSDKNTPSVPPGSGEEPKWKLFRRTRGGVALTRAEVKYIKAERKKLRAQMKAAGLKSKYDFETTASSLGLYFDKRRFFLLFWLFGGHGRWLLLGAAALLALTLFAMMAVTQMRGHFTINLSDGLFKEGFVLSETEDFSRPAINLFCEPAVDVPCISVTSLPTDIDDHEGQHNGLGYFAYTYFLRNDGESAVDYAWELQITGESRDCSSAAWIMVIQDGKMLMYAEGRNGEPECVPSKDDPRGFTKIPVMELAEEGAPLVEPITTDGDTTYFRVRPIAFVDEDTVATGFREQIAPGEYHKYTVVVWLEGDDPDCTDDRIGGHLGLNMQYALMSEAEEEKSFWDKLWDSLLFWE
jgi:hypothetical protein